jgi:hypothetical protein
LNVQFTEMLFRSFFAWRGQNYRANIPPIRAVNYFHHGDFRPLMPVPGDNRCNGPGGAAAPLRVSCRRSATLLQPARRAFKTTLFTFKSHPFQASYQPSRPRGWGPRGRAALPSGIGADDYLEMASLARAQLGTTANSLSLPERGEGWGEGI